ncbi:Hypothetical protein POVN_LOCUS202 [uncultured virus]|nr:Hypothetical protein POVN_LOCUS202 [uncultured virus]
MQQARQQNLNRTMNAGLEQKQRAREVVAYRAYLERVKQNWNDVAGCTKCGYCWACSTGCWCPNGECEIYRTKEQTEHFDRMLQGWKRATCCTKTGYVCTKHCGWCWHCMCDSYAPEAATPAAPPDQRMETPPAPSQEDEGPRFWMDESFKDQPTFV